MIMMTCRTQKYKSSCGAYLTEYIKHETIGDKQLTGWYHFIDNSSLKTVGVVATAQALILLKEGCISVNFDCKEMVMSMIAMQNEDGGWNYRSNLPESATDPTAWVVRALLLWRSVIDYNEQECIKKGIYWLLKCQNSKGLWGPINLQEDVGYCYFSCVSISCLHEALLYAQDNTATLIESIKQAIKKGCSALLSCFHDNDQQCGWGIIETDRPTLFHTAYVVDTLVQIDRQYSQKHQIIKSLMLLREAHDGCSGLFKTNEKYNQGIIEFYHGHGNRISYTHSLDVYLLLALLNDRENQYDQKIHSACECLIIYAEKTDWRYQEYVTCWRMYDLVHFCNRYYCEMLKHEVVRSMKNPDVLVVIATEEEEAAIIAHDTWEKRKLNDNIFYYETESKGIIFALARGFNKGEASAAQIAQMMISNLHPRVLTMAGFCAGRFGKVNLGDIIVADKVYNYEAGKQLNKGFILPEISNYSLDVKWRQFIERKCRGYKFDSSKLHKPKDIDVQCLELLDCLYKKGKSSAVSLHDKQKYPNWSYIVPKLMEDGYIEVNDEDLFLLDEGRKKITTYKVQFGEIKEPDCKVRICPIATGMRVMEWDRIFDFLEQHHDRKTGALDMESHAIGMLSEANEIKFIVVKGVGDYATNGKTLANRYIEYTSYMSYQFIKELFTDEEFKPLWFR